MDVTNKRNVEGLRLLDMFSSLLVVVRVACRCTSSNCWKITWKTVLLLWKDLQQKLSCLATLVNRLYEESLWRIEALRQWAHAVCARRYNEGKILRSAMICLLGAKKIMKRQLMIKAERLSRFMRNVHLQGGTIDIDELHNKRPSALNTDKHTPPDAKKSKLDIEDEAGTEDDHEDSIDNDYDSSDSVEADEDSLHIKVKGQGQGHSDPIWLTGDVTTWRLVGSGSDAQCRCPKVGYILLQSVSNQYHIQVARRVGSVVAVSFTTDEEPVPVIKIAFDHLDKQGDVQKAAIKVVETDIGSLAKHPVVRSRFWQFAFRLAENFGENAGLSRKSKLVYPRNALTCAEKMSLDIVHSMLNRWETVIGRGIASHTCSTRTHFMQTPKHFGLNTDLNVYLSGCLVIGRRHAMQSYVVILAYDLRNIQRWVWHVEHQRKWKMNVSYRIVGNYVVRPNFIQGTMTGCTMMVGCPAHCALVMASSFPQPHNSRFFLLGTLKDRMYNVVPTMTEDMQECIMATCRGITPETLQAACRSLYVRLQMCIAVDAKHIEHMLFPAGSRSAPSYWEEFDNVSNYLRSQWRFVASIAGRTKRRPIMSHIAQMFNEGHVSVLGNTVDTSHPTRWAILQKDHPASLRITIQPRSKSVNCTKCSRLCRRGMYAMLTTRRPMLETTAHFINRLPAEEAAHSTLMSLTPQCEREFQEVSVIHIFTTEQALWSRHMPACQPCLVVADFLLLQYDVMLFVCFTFSLICDSTVFENKDSLGVMRGYCPVRLQLPTKLAQRYIGWVECLFNSEVIINRAHFSERPDWEWNLGPSEHKSSMLPLATPCSVVILLKCSTNEQLGVLCCRLEACGLTTDQLPAVADLLTRTATLKDLSLDFNRFPGGDFAPLLDPRGRYFATSCAVKLSQTSGDQRYRPNKQCSEWEGIDKVPVGTGAAFSILPSRWPIPIKRSASLSVGRPTWAMTSLFIATIRGKRTLSPPPSALLPWPRLPSECWVLPTSTGTCLARFRCTTTVARPGCIHQVMFVRLVDSHCSLSTMDCLVPSQKLPMEEYFPVHLGFPRVHSSDLSHRYSCLPYLSGTDHGADCSSSVVPHELIHVGDKRQSPPEHIPLGSRHMAPHILPFPLFPGHGLLILPGL
ncbi:hypothetical protein PR048_018392 [Dryococelus australis]|uniref:Uncharacterized protein n=1 Tax=Dryococelus australis TaxID=614101 RepID=A0ABQ9HC93_9NEOP|nr:hypothetical protein PR048_018392 [Dryococelus australis]